MRGVRSVRSNASSARPGSPYMAMYFSKYMAMHHAPKTHEEPRCTNVCVCVRDEGVGYACEKNTGSKRNECIAFPCIHRHSWVGQLFIVCVILLFSFGLKIGEFLCARHNSSICVCFQDTIMALQAKRLHIAPQTQHGKRSGIFYELFFRDILLQGRRQLPIGAL